MTTAWSRGVVEHLLNRTACPRCNAALNADGTCPRCRADLRGPIAHEVWTASQNAADAIHARQAIIDDVPTLAAAAIAVTARPVSTAPAPTKSPVYPNLR